MKKHLSAFICLFLACALAVGCGKAAPVPQSTSTVPGKAKAIDLDLTGMSGSMVYAVVYDMMTNPDDYMGQTIKASGPYTPVFYDETDKTYHFVVVEDATACCQQGLEFVWAGQHNYPEDYPASGTALAVTGIFTSYQERDQTYYYLAAADVAVL